MFIGEDAFRVHTMDVLYNEKVPESGAVVYVDGETFTLLGRFTVGMLCASTEALKGGKIHKEIHNELSLACNEEVLGWDDPVVDGNEYTKVDAPRRLSRRITREH